MRHRPTMRAARGGAAAIVLCLALVVPSAASAANWLEPVSVQDPSWTDGMVDNLAVDARGDAVALVNRCAASCRIEAISWPAGGLPGAPELLSSPTSPDAWTGRVAMDADGDAVAIWNEVDTNGVLTLRGAVSPAGSAWQPAQELSGHARADNPQLAMTPSGQAVAAWLQADPALTNVTVEAAVLRPGATSFDPARDVSAPMPRGAEDLHLSMADSGEAVLAWQVAGDSVQAAIKPADDTAFGATSSLSQPEGPGAFDPVDGLSAAIDGRGDAVVAWRHLNTPPVAPYDYSLHEAYRPAGGAFARLADLAGPGSDVYPATVMIDGQGRAQAVWWTVSGRIYAAAQAGGADFGPAQEVSEPGVFSQNPEVAMDHSGTAVLVWEAPGAGHLMRWAVRPPAGAFGAPQSLGGAGCCARLAMAPDGTAMVTFHTSIGLSWSVRPPSGLFGGVHALDPAPGAVDPADVAFDATGNAVGVWDVNGPYAGNWQVRLARYALDEPSPPVPPSSLTVDQHAATCRDDGPGTAEQPLCTIGAAAAIAGAGTTVTVAGGTYHELIRPPSGVQWAPVTFRAAPGATVVLTGARDGFSIAGGSWITIKGFTIRDTLGDGISVADATHVSLLSNHVIDAGAGTVGVRAKGIKLLNTSDSLVQDNLVERSGGYGIALDGSPRDRLAGNVTAANRDTVDGSASGIRLFASPENVLASNVSHDNQDSGIELVHGSDATTAIDNVIYANGDHGIHVLDSRATWILSNSITRSATAGIDVDGTSTQTTVADNISAQNRFDRPGTKGDIRVAATATASTKLDFDLVHGDGTAPVLVWAGTPYRRLADFTADTGQEAHGLQADPGWAAPAAGDLHLVPGSPAIDSATSDPACHALGQCAAGTVTTDADGHARGDDPDTPDSGAGPRTQDDRGAYELRNGGFERGAADWNTSGSGAGVTLQTIAGGRSGASASELADTSAGPAACVLNDSPDWLRTTGSGPYTATLWVRAAAAGATLTLRLREWSGGALVGSAAATTTLSTTWQRVAVTYTAMAPGASTLDLNAIVSHAAPGVCFDADDASVSAAPTG